MLEAVRAKCKQRSHVAIGRILSRRETAPTLTAAALRKAAGPAVILVVDASVAGNAGGKRVGLERAAGKAAGRAKLTQFRAMLGGN